MTTTATQPRRVRARPRRGATSRGVLRGADLCVGAAVFILLPWAGRTEGAGGGFTAAGPPGLSVRPLEARDSSPEGATLFSSVPSEASGIDFVYRWDPPPRYAHEMVNGVTGGGVCAGDFDGDGLPDLYFTQPFAGNRLFRNLGGFRFEDVTSRAGIEDVRWGTGASFADVDNDGDLDLFVCGYDCPNRLFRNNGDGTFDECAGEAGLDYRGASVMASFADYDRDGDLDLYLVTNHIAPTEAPVWRYEVRESDGMPILPPDLQGVAKVLYRPDIREGKLIPAGECDRLYRNDGQGRFTDVTKAAGIADQGFGLAATWWDYDRDGWPDLYVSNDFWEQDYLYRNRGDGTFEDVARAALPHTPWFSMGSDAADIDNDGRLDFMASDMSSTTHYKEKLSMGDMQGWFLEYAEPRQYMRNAFYLNTGTGRFMEIAHLLGVASTDWTWSVKFADLDLDGLADLYITNGAERFWDNSDLMKSARYAQRIDTPELKDIWLPSPQRNDPNLAFRNTGNLGFEDVSEEWGLGEAIVSYGAAIADFDLDGDPDIAVNSFDRAASLYRNRSGADRHAVRVSLRGAASNSHGVDALVEVSAGGTTQTRHLTLARGFMSANEPVIHLGLGSAAAVERLVVRWPSGHRQEFADLEADRWYVVGEPEGQPEPGGDPGTDEGNQALFARSAWDLPKTPDEAAFDDYAAQPLLPWKHSGLGPGLALSDVNGDGRLDLFLGGPADRFGRLFLGNGDGTFDRSPPGSFSRHAASEDMGALFFDADADGDSDLLVVSGSVEHETGSDAYADRLYLNDGSGRFAVASDDRFPGGEESGSCAVACDFDRDGDLDVFIGGRIVPGDYPSIPRSRLLINDGGSFSEAAEGRAVGLDRVGMVTAALWSDVDGDGWTDLLVALEWGPVTLFLNREGSLENATESAGLSGRSGWWNSIAGADLDADGDIDYVVGNTGLNSKYHPHPDTPIMLYYGDFDGTGRRHTIEAKLKGGTLLPVRGKSCSQNAMPFLRERFPTFHSFASATLPEIYSSERLDAATRLEVDTLESGVLWNESAAGAPAFEFAPLPRTAQASPVNGIGILDADGDGRLDLVLAQNSFAPQPETGRMDGAVGSVLLNRGDRTFAPIRADRSGFLVPGDAKALCVGDLNGDGFEDVTVAENNGPLHILLSSPPRGAMAPIVVRLAGPPGNPDGVGAKVTVRSRDGSVLAAAEVHAGAGYLSQSPARATFPGRIRAEGAASLEVRWPDGSTSRDTLPVPSPDRAEAAHVVHHPAR